MCVAVWQLRSASLTLIYVDCVRRCCRYKVLMCPTLPHVGCDALGCLPEEDIYLTVYLSVNIFSEIRREQCDTELQTG